MIEILKKLNYVLDQKDKLFIPVVVAMAIIFSFLEMLSIGVLLPYVELIVNPGKLEQNKYLSGLIEFTGFVDIQKFLFVFSIFLLGMFVCKLIYSTFFTYVQLKFGRNVYNKLTKRIFFKITHQPYLNFIKTNSADYTKALLMEANGTVSMIPTLSTMLAEFLTIILLFGLLLFTSWKTTLVVSTFFLMAFIIMSQTLTKVIKKEGVKKSHFLGQVYRALDEAFGNIKILKLNCHEAYGEKKFMQAVRPYNDVQVKFGTLQVLPRNVIEFVGFSAFIIVVLVGMTQGKLSALLPILTLFAISFYRMLPSINRIMANYNQIIFYQRCIEIVYDFLTIETKKENKEGCEFTDSICMEDVTFSYEPKAKVLDCVNLNISKGAKVGIVGPSGSGKSTLIDILIGMLETPDGHLVIDDAVVTNNNIRAWRQKIGYIPQAIYLFDGTVAENVCLGFEYEEERIKSALHKANIFDFLETKDGIHTVVGENGIMLSGGQKQRIAIARALYNDPEVLVLDEATSALDQETEEKIINEIFDLAKNKTVIMVAHRLSTLERCDQIYEVSGGQVKAQEALSQ